ncbi:MAG: GntR family transcriptional regulator [Alphaproteobacteria bacterium]
MEKLRERAYDSFTRHLLASAVRPGQFVSQRELVGLTGMPLGAIRELIPRLEAEGLITTIPQRGMQIAPIDFNLVRDAYQFRMIVEKEAVAQFSKEAPEAAIDELIRRHLEILDEAGSDSPAADLNARAQSIDWDFHDQIVDHLGNEIVSNAYRINSIKIRLIRQELVRIEGHVRPVMDEHMKVLNAIKARDSGAAVKALANHIETARDRALGLTRQAT